MSKITINDILSESGLLPSINSRFQQIENEFNQKILYRDNPGSEANEMNSPLDMNGERVINLPMPIDGSEPARLQDLLDAYNGTTQHSFLLGLDSDDHPQYLTEARGDLLYLPLAGPIDGASVTDNGTPRAIETALSYRPVMAESFAAIMLMDLSGYTNVFTASFYAGNGRGNGQYVKDGVVTGTPSTAYADNSGFYDANGDGFRLSLDQRITPDTFGATPGTTDNTTPIQNCADFVGQGKAVFWNGGRYRFTDVTIPAGQGWFGFGMGTSPNSANAANQATVLEPYANTSTALVIMQGASQIIGFGWNGRASAGVTSTLLKGGPATTGFNQKVQACWFYDWSEHAIDVDTGDTFIIGDQCEFTAITACTGAVVSKNTTNLVIEPGCRFVANGSASYAIYAYSEAGNNNSCGSISGALFESDITADASANWAKSIRLDSPHFRIEGNNFQNPNASMTSHISLEKNSGMIGANGTFIGVNNWQTRAGTGKDVIEVSGLYGNTLRTQIGYDALANITRSTMEIHVSDTTQSKNGIVTDGMFVGSTSARPFYFEPSSGKLYLNYSTSVDDWVGMNSGNLQINSSAAMRIDAATWNFMIGSSSKIVHDGTYLYLYGLPTSNPGGSGRVWNDAGTLKIT